MRKTLDGFQGGLQIGRQIVVNLRWAGDIILLDTSEAELQELVDWLDWVNSKYNLVHQHLQYQGNGERQHSVPNTHSQWATEAGGYGPVPWVWL